MNKKFIVFLIVFATSMFFVNSLYELNSLSPYASNFNLLSTTESLMIHSKINDIKFNIFIEVVIIGAGVCFLNWEKIKNIDWK